jgi:hypothetical protein
MNGGKGLRCVRYEMTQREFRRLRREKWSPSFISKLGKLASKLYRELYKKEPPFRQADRDDLEPVNVYPYGILEQAYQRLIAAGEQIGEPYREPDPALKPKEPIKVVPPTKVAQSFLHARSIEKVMRILAERQAKIAAGWQPEEDDDGFENDTEQDDELY